MATKTISSIKEAVARVFDVRVVDLDSHVRTKQLIVARHIAMWLCRYNTSASYPEIGRAFGNRDHTTVISAVQKIDRDLTPGMNQLIAVCIERLNQEADSYSVKFRVA
jgi:chromosomal replication initiator protein